ncbi:UDP-N-acetylglucosamine 1-carboxyvinyltransferase MurA [Planctomycetes bacterium Pan216]|uniref:UDP-N-acetylglucosamine 1-carboxyvinyltransferase n=1 Tax=Kolteria novifilia TaxID=2527975 RepID=A0A518BAK8_9BACT|nr:UDP-N-acetylglucosamine 1-carboxyvinyltransferase MurA [Planctomycetes bacterium Pan216]
MNAEQSAITVPPSHETPAGGDVLLVSPNGPPRGELTIDGAKNSALPLMAAALLVEEGITVLERVPAVDDIFTMMQLLRQLGVAIDEDWRGKRLVLDATELVSDEPDLHATRSLRGSVMLMAPLLARLGSFRLGHPGGCALGTRGIDIHLRCLRRLGARIDDDESGLVGRAERLVGQDLLLDLPTHTGTQQLVLAAVSAQGVTRLHNASQEPEVTRLCHALVRMGARIGGIGTSLLTIEGPTRLRGETVRCCRSRLETGLFAMAGALPGADLILRKASPEANPVLVHLRGMGATIDWVDAETLSVRAPRRLHAESIRTWSYPGFPTDNQPPLTTLATQAHGRTTIHETMYESRFAHVDELRGMGASILVDGNEAVVQGPTRLRGEVVSSNDLQSGAALLLAGLAAEGETVIRHGGTLHRGYADLPERLAGLGCRSRLDAEAFEPMDWR